MSSSLNGLQHRLEKVSMKLDPPVRETRLPMIFLNPETGEEWPGWEAYNCEMERFARVHRIAVQYLAMSPWFDGTAWCSRCGTWFEVDPDQAPIYGMLCTSCKE